MPRRNLKEEIERLRLERTALRMERAVLRMDLNALRRAAGNLRGHLTDKDRKIAKLLAIKSAASSLSIALLQRRRNWRGRMTLNERVWALVAEKDVALRRAIDEYVYCSMVPPRVGSASVLPLLPRDPRRWQK